MTTDNIRFPEPATEEPTIGRLIADASRDVSTIVRDEIALAKTEITGDVRKIGKGGGLLVGAGVLAVFGLTFLFHTIAQGLIALGLAPWLGYLIVTLIIFLVAAILGLTGKSALSKVKGKPERTIATTKETIDTVKSRATG